MDVPLAINDIGIRNGLMGSRKSSAFSQQTDVVGLSAYSKDASNKNLKGRVTLSFIHSLKN